MSNNVNISSILDKFNLQFGQIIPLVTSGLQEYIEAVTFHFYLKDNTLISHKTIQDRLIFQPEQTKDKDAIKPETESGTVKESDTNITPCNIVLEVLVPPAEYVLGIADLTGEMMRRAINSVGDGELDRPFEICSFLQEIESAYSGLNNCNREVNRKLTVLRQSLRKVEAACYTLKVRGSEIPKHMLVDVISKSSSAAQFLDDPVIEED